MGKVRPRMDHVQFHCGACGHRFDCVPGRVEEVADKSYHPWDYFADCPECGEEAGQDAREARMLKAWANATGPRTPEGKARSAANLNGHPTPEETRITRFNAMKHGLNAEVATYFPAKPGRYPDCERCPYLEDCRPGTACQKRTELFLRHDIAFQNQDPGLLQELRARQHALLSSILDLIYQDILARGVVLEAPCWYYDKDGGFHLAQYVADDSGNRIAVDKTDGDLTAGERTLIMEVKEHPLLKRMVEIIKHAGLGLEDAGMTMKTQEDDDNMRGYLEDAGSDRETLLEYQRRQTETMDKLGALIDRAERRKSQDPVLTEHGRGADAD